jgi:hypothetical protein
MNRTNPGSARTFYMAALAFALSACGGSASGPSTLSGLVANAPSSASMNLEVGGVSNVQSTLPFAEVEPSLSLAVAPATSVASDFCHPHLFVRTAEVVWRLNAIFARHLRHVDTLIARHPDLLAGDSATWTLTGTAAEPQRQFTISRSADGLTYDFTLALAPAGQTPPAWVTVLSGDTINASAAGVTEQKGQVLFDYDALQSVVPAELLSGKITVTFDRLKDPAQPAPGVKRTTDVAFENFKFGPADKHAPRTGTYTHVAEPGVGGSINYQDDLVLLCPANPTALEADTVTQSRWYLATDGSVHGRADARANGGQIVAGDTWMGVTCHQAPVGSDPASVGENYWLMKLEDSLGTTLEGHERPVGGGTACDSAFGVVPTLDSSANDYTFPAAPVTFPNEW